MIPRFSLTATAIGLISLFGGLGYLLSTNKQEAEVAQSGIQQEPVQIDSISLQNIIYPVAEFANGKIINIDDCSGAVGTKFVFCAGLFCRKSLYDRDYVFSNEITEIVRQESGFADLPAQTIHVVKVGPTRRDTYFKCTMHDYQVNLLERIDTSVSPAIGDS